MNAPANDLPEQSITPETAQFFGHPRGLATLFFTEMWERFSFTGMQSLLFFFATAPLAQGGLGWSVASAGGLLGLYGALAFIGSIGGGWLADSWLGQRRAVSYGCVLIMLGHICMIGHGEGFLLGGLALLLLGMSMFKANMNTMVGMLYAPGDRRRDAGFSIFYMGISVGSVLAPLVCGFLAQSDQFRDLLRSWGMRPERSWHWGFGSAAVGMSLGLTQYWAGQKYLGQVGLRRLTATSAAATKPSRRILLGLAALGLLIALATVLHVQGVVRIQMAAATRILGAAVLTGLWVQDAEFACQSA